VPVDQLQSALALTSVGRELFAEAAGLRHWDGNSKREYRI
jgi:hypothetical protein